MTQEQEFEFRARAEAEAQSTPAAAPDRSAGKFGDTSVSAAPQGLLENLKALGGEFIGRTQERAHENLQAMRDREAARTDYVSGKRPDLPFSIPGQNYANMLSALVSPVGALGDMAGVHGLVPNYGAPGQAPGAERKFGDFAEALTPIPGKPVAEGTLAALRLAKGLGARAGGAVAPAVKPLAEMLGRGRVAKATANEAAQLVEAVKQRALTAARGQEAVAKTGAQVEGRAAATKISQAKAAEAQFADAVAKQEAAKVAAGSAKPFTAGKAATAGEQGAAQRTAVVAKREETLKPFVEADAKLRPEYEAAIAEKEAQGLSVADTPKAKAMLKESVDTMSPDPGTRPTVSAVPRSDTGGRMHEMIIDALQNNKVSLTKAEYEAAKEAGHEVSEMTVANGDIPGESSYSRTFKTPVEALDNLGRYFGEQAFGKGEASGFPAVSKKLLEKKYFQIQEALNEFVPERIPVQENWAAKLAADAPYKGTSVGKKALETVKKTDIPKATEEALAQTAFNSRQGYRDAKALAGPEAAKSGLLSRLTNLFHDPATGGPKPYDEVVRALAEGQGKLQGIIDEEPQVAALVKSHLQQLNDAKMMGVKATEFGDMAAKLKTEASGIRTSAGEKVASGQKLAATRRGFSKAINNLEVAKDSEAISQSHAIVNGMLDKKFITSAQHKEFTVAIQKAEDAIAVAKTAAERKAARDKLVEIFAKGALATAGGGALYGVGKTAHDALF